MNPRANCAQRVLVTELRRLCSGDPAGQETQAHSFPGDRIPTSPHCAGIARVLGETQGQSIYSEFAMMLTATTSDQFDSQNTHTTRKCVLLLFGYSSLIYSSSSSATAPSPILKYFNCTQQRPHHMSARRGANRGNVRLLSNFAEMANSTKPHHWHMTTKTSHETHLVDVLAGGNNVQVVAQLLALQVLLCQVLQWC